MPDWPGLMNASVAARYLGISIPTLQEGCKVGRWPAPVRDGNRVFWAKRQLDDFIAVKFGLIDPPRKNSWD
jgi:predicted site-specific integrase-resolvase